jgi:hypothetical protein
MTNSTGIVEKIENGVAWGTFTSGPRDGTTFDLPEKYAVGGDNFNITVGADVTFVPDSADKDQKNQFQDSYIIIVNEQALLLHTAEDGGIEQANIVKRLH